MPENINIDDLIKVTPLTREQADALFDSFTKGSTELSQIPIKSLSSIPDVIEGNPISSMQKIEMLMGDTIGIINYQNDELSYGIRAHGYLYKSQLVLDKDNQDDIFTQTNNLTNQDVVFKNIQYDANFKLSYDNEIKIERERPVALFDLMYGHLGSGTTVSNRLQIQNNDYKNIAHISDSGKVDFYDKTLPEDIRKQITEFASAVIQPDRTGRQAPIEEVINAIAVVPLTEQEKSEVKKMLNNREELKVIPYSSLLSIPDTIEGNELTVRLKLELLSGSLKFDNTEATYLIDQNNRLRKTHPNGHDSLVNKSDVAFKEVPTRMNEITLTDLDNAIQNAEGAYLQKNFDYLKNQIKYLGFTEESIVSLKEKMKSLDDKIQLPISRKFYSGKSEILTDFTLHLAKGKENDMYFLNSYSAKLKDNENAQPQTFYINKGKGFTAKEAFNLLSGRAVNKDLTNKDGLIYNAWVKLKPSEQNAEVKELNGALNKPSNHTPANRNFQIFNENYGYNLKESIGKFQIKEMETEEAQNKLITSLKKGNLQPVTLLGNGGETQGFIEANPQYKNINIYNEDGAKQFITHENKPHQQTQVMDKQPNDINQTVQEENMSKGIKR